MVLDDNGSVIESNEWIIVTHFIELANDIWSASYSDISFQVAIAASFRTLRTLFGEPRDAKKIAFNSRYEWDVKDIDSKIIGEEYFTIYEWISQGILPENYPTDAEVRSAPEYKWNIGAANMRAAEKLVSWLHGRDPSVRRVSDWADPIPFATERKKHLMNNYTIAELREVIDRCDIYVPDKTNKKIMVDAIVEAEQQKQCGL
jgi:hypothetical protein